MRARAPRIALAAGLAGIAGMALAGCGRGGGPGAVGPFRGAPVVLISIDTLRSDHLPAYGYDKVATPAIDALAREAVLFERAYSHIPLTLPSHTSILTGRLPGEHGVRDNVGYRFDAKRFPDLPVVLGRAGYRCGAAVSAYVLRAETGLDSGFDFYDAQVEIKLRRSLAQSQRAGTETERVASDWLRGESAHPVFLFFHLYEPHAPYTPPEPFASRYPDRPYDGEIAAADAVVGELVAQLKSLGLYDRALVILLSDHGEGLGEHGEREHGLLLYRATLQVPLLLKLPGGRLAGTRVAAPAQLVDVYPTVLSLVGLPVPAGLPGRPLLDLLRPGAPARYLYAETWYPRLHFGWSELSSLIGGHLHLISGPDPELYDLAADPGEARNVLDGERRAYADLRTHIQGFERQLAPPSAVDAETRQRLAALGYAGGVVHVAAGERLPDPKSRIAGLTDLALAMDLSSNQKCSEAVPAFRRALAASPRMSDAWENLGHCLEQLGERDEALAAFERAMEVSGGMAHVALATASLLAQMGRFEDARAHARLGLAEEPDATHELLAEISLAGRRFPEAEQEARAALAGKGMKVAPLLTLARLRSEQGRLDEALAFADQAGQELAREAGGEAYRGLELVRGDVLARLGRAGEAEQAFLREIHAFPAEPAAYARLAALYVSVGRPADAVMVLHRLVEDHASPAAYLEAARTLRILGDPRGAEELLRHARQLFPRNREIQSDRPPQPLDPRRRQPE